MLKLDPNTALPDHCLPNRDSNPVLQTGLDNHHSALSWSGNEEKRVNLRKWNKKDPVRWPMMSDQVTWNALGYCVYLLLPTHGPVVKKIGGWKRFCMRNLILLV